MALTNSPPARRRRNSLGLKAGNILELTKAVKSGLSFARLTHFEQHSGLAEESVRKLLQIPPRTLARRKASGRLSRQESERLVRLGSIFDQAVGLFEGDIAAAAAWLQKPAKALGNQTPLSFAETEFGAREVEDLIGRLEFGVYS